MQKGLQSDFVHLHVHSEFSLLDGMGKIPELVARASELGMGALALTDHGSMYGAMNFYLEARRQGIKPIVGCEVYVAARSMNDKEHRRDQSSSHLTLLARDETGYRNLIGMVSRANLEGFYYKPRIDLDLLAANSEGIICLSGCPASEVSRRIRDGNLDSALQLAGRYREIFTPERFFIEVMNHDLPFEKQLNRGLLDIADSLGSRLVGTQDVHYVAEDDWEAHDALLCIGTKARVDDENRMRMTDARYHLAAAEEMQSLFAEFPGAYKNTLAVAEQCDLQLDLGRISLPAVELPEGVSAAQFLRRLATNGLEERRSGAGPEYHRRLEHELSIICELGFEVYFLIHAEIFQFVRQRGILAGPRGSVGGSLVAFALGISGIDPIQRDIPFERFLNDGRRDRPPDIDMDFPDNHRATVIEYLTNKYGAEHVAQIATFGTLAARQVLRDVGRVLGVPYDSVDRIAKAIPQNAVDPWDLQRAVDNVIEIQSSYAGDPQVRKLIDLGLRLEGISRNPSVHAAGVVVSNQPLAEHVPLMRGQQGEIVSQFTFETLETIGFLKLDILGLTTFRTIDLALTMIESNHGRHLTVEDIPFDDQKTFSMLSSGRTVGCFQLESEGMTRSLVQLQPTRVEDLAVLVALYRPGPMGNIDQYVAMKRVPDRVKYMHPLLEPVLRETYGVMVYQDQVLIAARELAGFSWPEIDVLRKALGKKIPAELKVQREKFVAGATERNIDRDVAVSIYELVEPFGGYGFNKAHAFYYGTVAYWTAYLKANYPREFMAAVLTTAAGDTAKLAAAIGECRQLKLDVEPPTILRSGTDFEVVGESIYFGLASIKGVGRHVADSIAAARSSPFTDMADLCKRSNSQLGRLQLERLVKSGAMDEFGDRARLLAAIEPTIRHLQSLRSAGLVGQQTLFGGAGDNGHGEVQAAFALPNAPAASAEEKAAWERELLGVNFTADALDGVAEQLRAGGAKQPGEVSHQQIDTTVTTGGMITEFRSFRTRNNNSMCVFRCAAGDPVGLSVTVLPRMFEKARSLLSDGARIWVRGKVESDGAGVRLVVGDSGRLEPLANLARYVADRDPVNPPAEPRRESTGSSASSPARQSPPAESPAIGLLRVSLSGDERSDQSRLEQLWAVLKDHPGDMTAQLELRGEAGTVRLVLPEPVGTLRELAATLPSGVSIGEIVAGGFDNEADRRPN